MQLLQVHKLHERLLGLCEYLRKRASSSGEVDSGGDNAHFESHILNMHGAESTCDRIWIDFDKVLCLHEAHHARGRFHFGKLRSFRCTNNIMLKMVTASEESSHEIEGVNDGSYLQLIAKKGRDQWH